MSKSNAWETDILALLFNATAVANIADNASSAPLTNLYVSLHTADPGEAGTQATSEADYTSYARVAVPRTAGGWAITGNSAKPALEITFPAATGGTNTITHFAVGAAVSGASKVYYKGPVTPNIAVTNGVTPRLTNQSEITED